MKNWFKRIGSRLHDNQAGVNTVGLMIGAMIACLIGYNLVPSLVDANAVVQADADADTITKLAANIGEWVFGLAVMFGPAYFAYKKIAS